LSDDIPEAASAEAGESVEPEGTNPNAADPRSLRRIRNKARREAEAASEFWRGIFSTEIGRREMWDILAAASIFSVRFECTRTGHPQLEGSWYHAGQRDFGLRLYRSWMRFCPEGVMLMQQEHDPAMRPVKKRR
jgi:hypothetical protein